ncbi:MAG: polysaccharide biosynthesis tyrosine autokinase, partial [Clostridia bacterium]|nr:polysaccharide biosynthesis tyrosine autokinase [Clostridia bacterium]
MNENNSQKVSQSSAAEPKGTLEIRIPDIIKAFRKFWWVCLLLSVLATGFLLYRNYRNFTPKYQSSVTFTVQTQEIGSSNMGITSYSFSYNRSTATQLASTFPSIMRSKILSDLICNDLGITYIPCTLSSSTVSGTNMFTVTSTGNDPQVTYDVLQSVVENYPAVAEYVIGNVDLYILNAPELPTAPYNSFGYSTHILKGVLIGIAGGVLWIVLYASLRQTIRNRKDIREKLNQHCIGVLPEVTFKKYNQDINRNIIITNPMVSDGYLESFRACRNSIISSLGKNKVILVASTAPAEGKTSVSVNLALSLAKMNKKVVIVDSDIHNPCIMNRLSSDKSETAEEYVKYPVNLIDITEDDISLSVLRFNANRFDPWKILKYDLLSELFTKLRNKYDYIIVDTSPVGLTSTPAVFASISDTAILVVKQDTIRISRIQYAIDTLQAAGVTVMGCILNGASSGFANYGKYGRYGY